jgi:hypothetical protein
MSAAALSLAAAVPGLTRALISGYELMGELPTIPAAPVALPAPAEAEIAVAALLTPGGAAAAH